MSTKGTYFAVLLGNQTSPRWKAWTTLFDDERRAKEQEGVAAWKAWVEKHQDAIVDDGPTAWENQTHFARWRAEGANELAVFIVVRASSHKAAATMFEGHPHFTIFPGEAVEVMPLLPIPGA